MGGKTYPWTSIAHVDVISPLFGGELSTWLIGDPVAEGALLALEFP